MMHTSGSTGMFVGLPMIRAIQVLCWCTSSSRTLYPIRMRLSVPETCELMVAGKTRVDHLRRRSIQPHCGVLRTATVSHVAIRKYCKRPSLPNTSAELWKRLRRLRSKTFGETEESANLGELCGKLTTIARTSSSFCLCQAWRTVSAASPLLIIQCYKALHCPSGWLLCSRRRVPDVVVRMNISVFGSRPAPRFLRLCVAWQRCRLSRYLERAGGCITLHTPVRHLDTAKAVRTTR